MTNITWRVIIPIVISPAFSVLMALWVHVQFINTIIICTSINIGFVAFIYFAGAQVASVFFSNNCIFLTYKSVHFLPPLLLTRPSSGTASPPLMSNVIHLQASRFYESHGTPHYGFQYCFQRPHLALSVHRAHAYHSHIPKS